MKLNETTEWGKRCKETSPENTVERIKELLEAAGLETRYEDHPCDAGGMYSSRVSVTGPKADTIGSNGKGSSKAFCMASAYAELMERLQNRMFCGGPSSIDSAFITREQQHLHMPWYTVRDEYQPECVLALKKRLAATVKKESIFDPEPMEVVDNLLENVALGFRDGRYLLRAFWSVKQKKEILLPIRMLQTFQMSNGMAAGNTLEEAIVQASSEIFERDANIAVIEKNITPPQIPREYIAAHYPYIDRVISEIEAQGPYRVYMLDCSLGKGYPVACSVVINTETQTFGIKFGAHPSMGVALERTLSEAMQGRSIEEFSQSGYPNFMPDDRSAYINTWNLIKVGVGYYPSAMLYDTPDYDFKPWPDVAGMDNRQLMNRMLDKLMEVSGDVYIQDCSFLGFPTVFIYAPGISESLPVDILQLKKEKLREDVQEVFRHLDTATDEEVVKIMKFAMINRYALIENKFNNLAWLAFYDPMPCAPDDSGFLIAMCQYRLGLFRDSMRTLQTMKNGVVHMLPEDGAYYRAVLTYVSGKAYQQSEEDIRTVVRKMCSETLAERVIDELSDPKKVLEKVYPVCNHGDCAHCVHHGPCEYAEVTAICDKLAALEGKRNLRTENLEKLFG